MDKQTLWQMNPNDLLKLMLTIKEVMHLQRSLLSFFLECLLLDEKDSKQQNRALRRIDILLAELGDDLELIRASYPEFDTVMNDLNKHINDKNKKRKNCGNV